MLHISFGLTALLVYVAAASDRKSESHISRVRSYPDDFQLCTITSYVYKIMSTRQNIFNDCGMYSVELIEDIFLGFRRKLITEVFRPLCNYPCL